MHIIVTARMSESRPSSHLCFTKLVAHKIIMNVTQSYINDVIIICSANPVAIMSFICHS